MLEIERLEAGYGSLKVLRGVSLHVPRGKVVALLGSNGAGKTTTMKAIMGVVAKFSGAVRLDGGDISKLPPYAIVAKGMALVPQGRELFPEMSVTENLELGGLVRGVKGDALTAGIEAVFQRFPRLNERRDNRAGSLSGGEQQMLATGRALMSKPSVLLLDEPTTGLAPIIVQELTRIIRDLHASGQTILLVEQNVRMALAVADYVYVIRGGEIVMKSEAAKLSGSDEMFKAYLG
ncbi:MAG: ABC transporter ATP-binding protein [Alphaproteobacteria bacterium]|nr:ABC transporter ATP-binding protein [Alphaproteobacteria bacterium]